jgi:hypothetical protein
MKIHWKKPKYDNSQPGSGFHRECHVFFSRRYEDEAKKESPKADVVGDSHGQDFFEYTSPRKKSHAIN